ncbi:MAG TPA: UDP-glucose 4-epimerase GalE [Bacteroidales bacterium]|nr:UDP-glucose 4-epimerase GalE [Bacteroidales bacterium]HRZ50139.1 UDP-glucose 4-epimerase GalE [Bacteroidales bacterium]
MKRILVTGGTGYIGSHTAVALLEAGLEVVLLDNLSNSYRWVADRVVQISGRQVQFAEVDLINREQLHGFFGRQEPFDGVIHFAALKAVGESVENPLLYYRNNIGGLMNLLEAMQLSGSGNLVFSSSCTVYGNPEQVPVDEACPLQPAMSPYGNTKRIAEEMIRDQVQVGKLRAVALRYFNPVGAHPSALLGELPMGIPNNLMPFIAQTAIGIRERLLVFGNDYPTPDGTAIRDYIHITDLADAHVKAIHRLLSVESPEPWEIFNLGTGKGYSVLEMINAFETVNGVKVPWQYAPRRQGDIPAIWANPAKAQQLLGWKATRNLTDMVASAWKWQMALQNR